MNCINIRWPTGLREPMADIRSKDETVANEARNQARTMKSLVQAKR